MMQTVAWIASVLVFATFYMRDQVRMRQMAVLANITFICYALLGLENGIFDKVLPIFVLHVSSLGLNLKRLREAMSTQGGNVRAFATKAGLLLMSGVLSVTTQAHVPAISVPESSAVLAKEELPVLAHVSGGSRMPSSNRWQWPLGGSIQRNFGNAGNKGIDIMVGKTESVRAAASGRIVYSGNGLPGYGNLVIVQHEDGYQTAYGLNSVLEVREGQWVEQGQAIAQVSASSNGQAVLHFEIRHHGKPQNPVALLP